MSQVRLHSSNPNLCAELADFQAPVTRLTDSIDSASDYIKLQEDFCIIAQKGEQNFMPVFPALQVNEYTLYYKENMSSMFFFAGMNESYESVLLVNCSKSQKFIGNELSTSVSS